MITRTLPIPADYKVRYPLVVKFFMCLGLDIHALQKTVQVSMSDGRKTQDDHYERPGSLPERV